MPHDRVVTLGKLRIVLRECFLEKPSATDPSITKLFDDGCRAVIAGYFVDAGDKSFWRSFVYLKKKVDVEALSHDWLIKDEGKNNKMYPVVGIQGGTDAVLKQLLSGWYQMRLIDELMKNGA